jgi:ATP-binding cassette subfamily F protein uup
MPPQTALISANELNVRYNEQVVLENASLSIGERDRIGLVGRNGSGKSTFLRLLAGQQEADSGNIVRRRGLVIGYLPQNFELDPNLTVYENVREGARHVLDLIHQFETLPVNAPEHSELEERITAFDGWGLEHRINIAMAHLGVPPGDKAIANLSGGEKRRVAMCRALIGRPDLLILDEPTNHLDPDSIEWVIEFLLNFPGAFLVVTHDRYFLDRITSSIVELSNGTFYSYIGNYTDYLLSKAERQATEELVERKRQSFLRRELDWVRRGPPARTTKSKSRLDHFYEVEGQQAPEAEVDMELVIPPPPPLGNRIVDLTNLGVSFGDNWLFRNFSFNFEAGMRIGVAGRNGAGKTTLLKVILGEMRPTEGSAKTGSLVQFNYVDQSRLLLNDEKTVLDEVADGSEFVIFGNGKISLRAYLKRFLFTDDRITTQVKYLSGGERSRLLLARILKRGGNFLVLDEPTNDLDLQTLRVLEEALVAFPGCVLVVSHDRYFLNRVCTGIMSVGDGRITYRPGDYDYFLEKERQKSLPPAFAEKGPSPTAKAVPSAKPRKLSWKEAKELEGMESAIHSVEAEIARIEALFASPDFHREHGTNTQDLVQQLDEAKARLNQLFTRWEELENLRQSQS